MTKIGAIVLDFDGVLVESNEAKLAAFKDLFALYPIYHDAMMDYHLVNYSLPRMMKFEYYVYNLMKRPRDVATVQAMAVQFSKLVADRVLSCSDVPGARDFLDEFCHQVPLYVSSVTPESELRNIIHGRGMESFFADVFGDPPWQKPHAIRAVLTREQLLPSELIFIGDSVSDYHAALETGAVFVARDSGLPFNGIEIKPYRDLYEIADVIRNRMTD